MDKLIGITIGLKSIDESLWVNGIKLNAAMLYMLIEKIEGYTPILLDTSGNIEDLSKIKFWDVNKFKTDKIANRFKELDILIQLGTTLQDRVVKDLKSKGLKCKIVKYHCGNNYVIEMERIIFNSDKNIPMTWTEQQDESWYVPQQHMHNKDYYSITGRNKSIAVPFVWDPYFLDLRKQEIENIGSSRVDYLPSNDLKRIMSFEPNNNVVKFSMPLILLAEQSLRNGSDFSRLSVCSGQTMFKNTGFLESLKILDIYKKGKIKYLGRYPIVDILTTDTDVVLSHQWDNPLNYLYLDVMYFGYPLVHNADMIQDGGYYYKDFEIKEGAKMLDWVLQNHDDNIEEYKEKNRPVLDRYTNKNEEIIDVYKKLFDNLLNPGTHEMSYEYDWKTNSIL